MEKKENANEKEEKGKGLSINHIIIFKEVNVDLMKEITFTPFNKYFESKKIKREYWTIVINAENKRIINHTFLFKILIHINILLM